MAKIVISAEAPQPVDVELVGEHYLAHPPKEAQSVALGIQLQRNQDPEEMMKGVNSLVITIFGKKVAKAVMKRLENPEDPMDLTHIMLLMNALLKQASPNPTTSPSDSSTMP